MLTLFLFKSSKSKIFSETQGKLLVVNPKEITAITIIKLLKIAQNKHFYFRKEQFVTESPEKILQVM